MIVFTVARRDLKVVKGGSVVTGMGIVVDLEGHLVNSVVRRVELLLIISLHLG